MKILVQNLIHNTFHNEFVSILSESDGLLSNGSELENWYLRKSDKTNE